jgi:hypothetical protein
MLITINKIIIFVEYFFFILSKQSPDIPKYHKENHNKNLSVSPPPTVLKKIEVENNPR